MELKPEFKDLIEKSPYEKRYIAEELDVSVKQLWNWSNGHSYPTVPKLFKLAKLLNVNVDDLYREKE